LTVEYKEPRISFVGAEMLLLIKGEDLDDGIP
jgi:hypothetical protein